MSHLFNILPTTLSGLRTLQRTPIDDKRGYLERLFCLNELRSVLNGKTIVQINHSLTSQCGTVRGLHFQYPPHTEMKFVSCLRGKVFDVAVDVRQDSPTFLQWYGEILTADNHKTFIISEGFAHGFQTLTEECELLYFHTTAYRADAEGGLNARDPNLGIQWPLPITNQSPRDLAHPMLSTDFIGVTP